MRVLRQLRHDPRTVVLVLVVPAVLVTLVKYVFEGSPVFDRIGGPLLGIFPLISMFLVTSITMLRERTTGTLERLMTMPLAKLDLLAGYAAAFALVAAAQAVLVSAVAFWALDLHVAGAAWAVFLLAVANAILGTSFGLFVSAFARTEFQAVQFLPAFVFPQLLLCGLLGPRDQMARFLEIVSWAAPLTYAYDALARTTSAVYGARLAVDVAVVLGLSAGALLAGAYDAAPADALALLGLDAAGGELVAELGDALLEAGADLFAEPEDGLVGDPEVHGGAFLPARDDPVLEQDVQVLRDVLLARAARLGELADGRLAVEEPLQEADPHRLGEHPEPARDQLDHRVREWVGECHELKVLHNRSFVEWGIHV